MSYQNWACFGWMLPATIENLKKLGVDESQIEEKLGTPENGKEWEETDFINAMGNVFFTGKINDITFAIDICYIDDDCETDESFDANNTVYLIFSFQELFSQTPLYGLLSELGMKHHTWVTGG